LGTGAEREYPMLQTLEHARIDARMDQEGGQGGKANQEEF
jgi:hypothetical protein